MIGVQTNIVEHPRYTVKMWVAAILKEGRRDGYAEYVISMLAKEKPITQPSDKNFDVDAYKNAQAIKNKEMRGFTIEEVVEFIVSGNTYAAASKKFGRQQNVLKQWVEIHRREMEWVSKAPPIPEDIRTMSIQDFSKVGQFTIRAKNVLMKFNSWKGVMTVKDLIDEGVAREPQCGKKTMLEIKHTLIKTFGIPEEEFLGYGWGKF